MKTMIDDKINGGREYRNVQMEFRALESENDSEKIVEGYATTFNDPYLLYEFGDYRVYEQVDKRAFDECDMSDVIMQYDHQGRVFARLSNGTLQLDADDRGLHIRANLGGTEIGRQLYDEIRGGYTNKMSFGFRVAEDERLVKEDKTTGITTVTRTITKIGKLYDVSAVSLPANDGTEISARNFSDGLIAEIRQERSERERQKEQLMLKIKLSIGG